MNKFLTSYIVSLFFFDVNMQTIRYATRFRNYSLASETDSIYLIKFQIYQDKLDHKISVVANLTKDVHVKNIVAAFERCSFVNSACEDFQRWTLTKNLMGMAHMKNEMWTPMIENLTPKLYFPHIKKNIFRNPNCYFNTKAIMTFYPEAANPNHFWRTDIIFNDHNGKKAVIMKLEFSIHEFVERNKNRSRVNTQRVK